VTTKALSGCPQQQTIVEYCVGSAQDRIVYPGIMQCLSITSWSIGGLLGAHVSPGSSEQDIAEIFQMLRTGGGANMHVWYIVGNFQKHFQYTKVGWNSRAKIAKALRKSLKKNAVVETLCTTELPNQYSFGVNIHAIRGTGEVTFAYCKYPDRGTTAPSAITQQLTRA